MNPERFGPYRFEGLIGRGGMGEVFRAWDEQRNRFVAVKRLPRQMAQDREFRARFQRESALAAKLREPHIIPIHDYGEIDGLLYIDMRLVEGTDLAKVLKAGSISPERTVDIVSQIADALDAAHAEGLIHRDVKPSNILLVGPPERASVRGFAYLCDFGIASTLGGASTLSRPGLAVGTAAYMAPERMSGERVDGRADVYSMACMFFECLTGHRPFPASDLLQALRAHLTAPRPRPSEHGAVVPPALDDVVTRGMAKDPNDRYATAGDFADAARAALSAPAPAPEQAPAAAGLTDTAQAFAVGGAVDEAPAATSEGRGRAPDAPSAAPSGEMASAGDAERAHHGRPTVSEAVPAAWEDPAVSSVPPRPPSLVKSYVSPAQQTGTDAGPTGRPATGGAARPGSARPTTPVTPAARVGSPPPRPRLAPEPSGTPSRPASEPSGTPSRPAPEPSGAPSRRDAPRPAPRPQTPAPAPRPPRAVESATVARPAVRPESPAWVPPHTAPPAEVRAPQQAVAVEGGPAPPRSGRGRWVVVVAVLGAVIVAAAIVVPRLLSGTPAFEVVSKVVVGGGPMQIGLSPDGSRAYVTKHDVGAVSVIDTTTRRALDAQPQVGAGPDAVIVAPDGRRVYVANSVAGFVSVLDTATNAATATIAVGHAPDGLAISPDGKLLYVANGDDATVTVVDTASAKPVGSPVPVGKRPRGIAISPDGKRLYVAGFDSNDVTLIDTASATPIARAIVDDGPVDVAVSPDGARLFVVNQRSSTLSVIDTVAKTSDVAAARVDPAPSSIALDATGGRLYVTSKDADTIVAIDTAGLRAGKPFAVGDAPVSVAVGPKDGLIYVVRQSSMNVSILRAVGQ